MAERSVYVRLGARVESYVAAMRTASAATTGFSTTTQRNLMTVGTQMQTLGRTMTLGVTAPLALLGAASTRMASNFERSFAQMVGLANVPAEEIDHLKQAVLDLAGETAQAPQELAEGLYLAASAGLDSATALEVVETAAKASATGMGDTATVVDLLTTVLGSYGEANISASEAADVLTAAVAEGKAEPDEMAEALGRVLPVAASMGITFAETAGAVAFLTNAGLDTDEAVTALRGTMLALIDPTKQARDVLEQHGTSAAELTAAIDEGGLLGALELLADHGFRDNTEAMSDLIEDNRALVGATALLNDETGRLVPIIDAVTDSAGRAGEAFSNAADTDAFKLEQALAEIQTAMIELGNVLLPIVADIAGGIAGLARFFADLPGPVQTVIAALGGLLAVGGPVVFIAGSLVRNLQTLAGVAKLLGGPLGTVGTQLGILGVAAGTAYAAWKILDEGHLNAGPHISTAADALRDATEAGFAEAIVAGEAAVQVDALTLAHKALSQAIDANADPELEQAFRNFNVAADETLNVFIGLQRTSEQAGTAIDLVASRLGITHDQAVFFYQALTGYGQATESQMQMVADHVGVSYEAIASTVDDINLLTQFAEENKQEVADMARAYLDTQVALGGTARDAVLAAQEFAGLREEGTNAIGVYEKYVELLAEMTPAQRDAAGITEEMTGAMAELDEAIAGTTGTAAGAQKAWVTIGDTLETVEAGLAGTKGTTTAWMKMGDTVETVAGQFANAKDDTEQFADATVVAADAGMAAADAFAALEKAATGGWLNAVSDLAGLGDGILWSGDEIFHGAEALERYGEALHMVIDPQRSFLRSQDSIWQQSLDFTDSIDENSRSLEQNTEEGLTNRAVILDWADAILDGVDATLAAGGSIEDANLQLSNNRQALINAARAAGFNEQEVSDLVDAYGLVPASVSTAIKISGEIYALNRIEEMLDGMEQIDEGVVAEMEAILRTEGAWAAYDYLNRTISNTTITAPVRIRVTNPTLRYYPSSGAGGKMVAVAHGGLFDRPTFPTLIGEAGPEVVLPLTRQDRMAELLEDPRVFGPVSEAMPGGGDGGGATIVNQTVQLTLMNPDGPSIVRELQRLQRTSGPLPIRVR